jgi:spore germination protein YaaH
MAKIKVIVFLLAFLLASGGFAAGETAAKPAPQTYTRIFYYRDGKNARASLAQNYRSIDVLAPQAYSFDSAGALTGGVKSFVLELAKIRGIKVMPLVTNKAFNQSRAHDFLDDSAIQQKAIDALVAEAKKYGFWGWQIDFEQMDVSYRDKFSTFIKKFGEVLKNNNLTATVAVVAQLSENPNDYPKDLWQKLIGVYDYAAIASSTDFISLMSYDNPNSAGPVAGYSWLKKVLEHTLSLVPPEKISLGLPLYYWLWNDTKGKLVEIGGYEGILNAFKKHYLTTNYSTEEQAPYLSWRSYYNNYKLWYENAASVKKKLELVIKNKLHGFSAWALGLEVPTVHAVFQKM